MVTHSIDVNSFERNLTNYFSTKNHTVNHTINCPEITDLI